MSPTSQIRHWSTEYLFIFQPSPLKNPAYLAHTPEQAAVSQSVSDAATSMSNRRKYETISKSYWLRRRGCRTRKSSYADFGVKVFALNNR